MPNIKNMLRILIAYTILDFALDSRTIKTGYEMLKDYQITYSLNKKVQFNNHKLDITLAKNQSDTLRIDFTNKETQEYFPKTTSMIINDKNKETIAAHLLGEILIKKYNIQDEKQKELILLGDLYQSIEEKVSDNLKQNGIKGIESILLRINPSKSLETKYTQNIELYFNSN